MPDDKADQERRHESRDGSPMGVDGFSDDYLTAVAHDLRGSLNGIIGWAELIKRKALTEPGNVKAGETIIRQAKHQLDLISELVDTWRLLAGTLQLSFKPVDVRDLVRSAVHAAQEANQRDVRLDVRLDSMPAPWLVDTARLRQALLTLFSNAIHFSPEPGVVRIRLTDVRGVAELTVHDTGPGIGAEALPYVFTRQRPPDTAKDSVRVRHGRGLSFVRDLVDLHGGSIGVESAGPAKGLTFRICLPLHHQAHGAEGTTSRETLSAKVKEPRSRLRGVSVLVVDDDQDAREVVAAILRHFGASVATAASAETALTVLARQPVDLLVADIGMPVHDGYDLIREVRALESQEVAGIPAAALTAFTTHEDRDRALQAGFQAHLPKPVDSALLVATVERLCSGRQI